MTQLAMDAADLIDMLPLQDQKFAVEFIKKLIRAWDPDFTKLTPKEAEALDKARLDESVPAENIDWTAI